MHRVRLHFRPGNNHKSRYRAICRVPLTGIRLKISFKALGACPLGFEEFLRISEGLFVSSGRTQAIRISSGVKALRWKYAICQFGPVIDGGKLHEK